MRKTHKISTVKIGRDLEIKAENILKSQGFETRRVVKVPYRPVDIFGADVIGTKMDCMKFIQVTTRSFRRERVENLNFPCLPCIQRELWAWIKDKKCFYVYNLDGVKIREEA